MHTHRCQCVFLPLSLFVGALFFLLTVKSIPRQRERKSCDSFKKYLLENHIHELINNSNNNACVCVCALWMYIDIIHLLLFIFFSIFIWLDFLKVNRLFFSINTRRSALLLLSFYRSLLSDRCLQAAHCALSFGGH